jgi:multidrug efflux pump
MNGTPAILIILFRQPGANIIETTDNVRASLPQLQASLPEGVAMDIVMDRAPPIRASLAEVEFSLIAACLLVVLVVFCFLRRARATLIPGVAVVASLVGSFGVMQLLGFSLNNLSLMALTIATGFVVDDAIVVLENIAGHTERGVPPMQAALDGAKEVSFTVISMSVSLVAVFIPILLMGGMVGRLFKEFAVTLSVAIGISLLVSLTATPMMCARLLSRPEGREERKSLPWIAGLDAFFASIYAFYGRSLHFALRRRRLMMCLTLAILALNVWLYAIAPKGFFPQQDTGRIGAAIMADQDISFQAMSARFTQVIDVVRADRDVEHVTGYTGGGNSANMFISLKAPPERKHSVDQVIARLRGKLAAIPGIPTYLQSVQELRVGGRQSGALYQYTLQGETFQDIHRWAPRIQQAMRALPQVADVNSDQQNRGLQAKLIMDRDAASRLGISAAAMDAVLYGAFGQSQVSINYTTLNQYHVIMVVAPQFWQTPDSLSDIYVRTGGGKMTPLSAIARVEHGPATLAVSHQGQFPAVTLSFNLPIGTALGQAVDAVQEAARRAGLPQNINASFRGTAQTFQSSLRNQPLLILAALVAVYIVLGILYESAIHPLTILSTLPSAGVGAVLALLLTGTELNLIAVIGIILLIGIVKKNGIMIVDFALDAQRKDGLPPEEAIHTACMRRFRPIMMTTAAALLGALPLALSQGSGWELRRPLGISIIGGLLFSQVLTLYTTPAIYLSLDALRGKKSGARS